jgi:hypothetical protein
MLHESGFMKGVNDVRLTNRKERKNKVARAEFSEPGSVCDSACRAERRIEDARVWALTGGAWKLP